MYGASLFNGIGAEGSAGDPPVGKLPQSPDETSLLKTYGWKCAPHDDGSTQRGHGLFQGKALLGADLWRRVTAGKWWAKWACFFTGSTFILGTASGHGAIALIPAGPACITRFSPIRSFMRKGTC